MRTPASNLFALRNHHFYGSLDQNSIVVDLGAHLGEFSTLISDMFGCKCYAIEALPRLYEKIQETSLVKKFNYAVTATNQTVEFLETDNPEANHARQISSSSIKEEPVKNRILVEGITLESFMQRNNLEAIDLLKIDIEGSEIDLFGSLDDETLLKIKQITIEFHDFVFDIKDEVYRIKKRLSSLGFTYIVFPFFTNGDVLFINKECYIQFSDFIYIRFFAKYVEGFLRIAKRTFKQSF